MVHRLHISTRLMPALTLPGVGAVHVEVIDREPDSRLVYSYVIENDDGTVLAEGADLHSGVGDGVDYPAVVATVLAFLGAAAESYASVMTSDPGILADTANGSLFPPTCTEWAYLHAEELAMAREEIERDTQPG